MKLPFTVQQFLEAFKNYNLAVYPMQLVFYTLAVAIIFLSVRKLPAADKIINGILCFFWLWMGIVYHIIYFAPINKAANIFGAVFILQALLFLYHGVVKNKLSYQFRTGKYGWAGITFILFATIIYPVLGYLSGHSYPAAPTFGLPCPTTIFTFGVLLWADKKLPLSTFIIPFVWSIIGFFAALKLGIWQDTFLLIAGISAAVMITLRNRNRAFSTN